MNSTTAGNLKLATKLVENYTNILIYKLYKYARCKCGYLTSIWSPDRSTLKHSPTHFGLCFFMGKFETDTKAYLRESIYWLKAHRVMNGSAAIVHIFD